jgi:hypothetical protein
MRFSQFTAEIMRVKTDVSLRLCCALRNSPTLCDLLCVCVSLVITTRQRGLFLDGKRDMPFNAGALTGHSSEPPPLMQKETEYYLSAKFLLVLASTAILGSESHWIQDHILLSDGSGSLQTHSYCLTAWHISINTPDRTEVRTLKSKSEQSYVTTDGQSASLSWCQASIWGLRPDFYNCQTVAGLLMWGALSDTKCNTRKSVSRAADQRENTNRNTQKKNSGGSHC